jgi:hypothetical protein
MKTPEEELDEWEALEKEMFISGNYQKFINEVKKNGAKRTSALRDVLALHNVRNGGGWNLDMCECCSDFVKNIWVPYPCPTVSAIQRRLVGE